VWVHVGLSLVWGMFGRCSRVMVRGFEIRVLYGANTWSLIRPGHESSVNGYVNQVRILVYSREVPHDPSFTTHVLLRLLRQSSPYSVILT
jgi:hypothetical protein